MGDKNQDALRGLGGAVMVDRRGLLAGAAAAGTAVALGSRVAWADEAVESAWDKEADFVVVGAGGSVWGALAAIDAGADGVIILEKGQVFGGTTSLSSGALWIPMNYVMAEHDIEDSRENALAYLRSVALEGSTSELQEMYVDNGHAFVDWARDRWGFSWVMNTANLGHDYYPGAEGYLATGRACEVDAVASAKAIFGEDWEKPASRSNAQTFEILHRLCDENGVETLMGTAGKELVTDDGGAVVGVVAEDAEGSTVRIKARKGVLLATGGFDYNDEMRHAFLRTPIYSSMLLPTCTGDGHRMGMKVGAALANMTSVYGSTVMLPQGEYEGVEMPTGERCLGATGYCKRAGSVVVNRYGHRIGNESAAYANFSNCLEGWDASTCSRLNMPAFWIAGGEYTAAYALPGAVEIGEEPEWLMKAETLEELAEMAGIDPEGLAREMEAFNENAEQGIDPVWHRGEFGYDQVSSTTVGSTAESDGADKALRGGNVCLAPVATPPFYCAKIYPGGLGTAGGLKINAQAQVISVDGDPIPGLYASGCAASSPLGFCYGGAGGPVGVSCVLAYIAARSAMGA